MNSKPWWQSKTLWYNALMLTVAAASGQMGFPIPPKIAIPVVTIGNAILRLVTSQPVSAS